MKEIGVVGCGTIGTVICTALDRGEIAARLAAVSDIDPGRAQQLLATLRRPCPVLPLPELARKSDLVVEAAGQNAVRSIIDLILDERKDVLIMSSGALLAIEGLPARFERAGCRLYVPSGALAGLDAVKAAGLSSIRSITLTTRKSPQSLKGAPYCLEHGIDVDTLHQETVIFEGSAREAATGFPQNANVAATLSLASAGSAGVLVRIVVDPEATTNSHEIEVVAECGRLLARMDSVPCPSNPKTSYAAALSGIAMIKRIVEPVNIGT